jgi:hypothetical protein
VTIAKTALIKSPTSRETISLMGRAGYGARGVVYLFVGISAGRATFDPGHRLGGFTKALGFLQDYWAGSVVLALLATGMACLASWLAVSAICRRDHPGPAHSVLVAGLVGDAAIYLGFMVSLLGMIFSSQGGDQHLLQSWVSWLVTGIAGKIIVGFAAAIVFASGAGLVVWGIVGDIEGPLELPQAEKRLMLPIGRYGTAGRGVSIALVGCYLAIAAIQGDASRAHELGGILGELRSLPGGIALTAAFALAFIGSSALDFVVTVYRRFNPIGAGVPKRRRRRGGKRRAAK